MSTSTGIPDFRGPQGVWTLQAQGKAPMRSVSTLCAIPSPTHMALVELQKRVLLKFLISQNVDGLHRRSGFDPTKLAELHGNANLARCNKCGKELLFDSYVRRASHVYQHGTGIQCPVPQCGGELCDTIGTLPYMDPYQYTLSNHDTVPVNFGENLPEGPLNEGWYHSSLADLCLVLGSSLTVTPAASMPKRVAKVQTRCSVLCGTFD